MPRLPLEIQTLFRSFKPYNGGNNPLWTLNQLRNATHTALTPIGFPVGGMALRNIPGGKFEIPAVRWDSEKDEMIFAKVPAGSTFNCDFNLTFLVAFGEVDLGEGPITIDRLQLMSAEVRRVINDTEAECRRLGFMR